tara:strand:+ start:735 stop:2660 length:1926 start_codon:yes stop_codon:yes gene_type:complete
MFNNNSKAFRRKEKIATNIFDSSDAASLKIANEVAELISEKQSQNRNCVLGLATGSSPIKVYQELVRKHKEEGLSFINVHTFNLDEYYPMAREEIQSYWNFMHIHLFDHVDIPKSNIHIPDGTLDKSHVTSFCEDYEQKIDDLGGLDLQILGIGRTGHIGFNEPGSGLGSPTRLVTLDYITILDASGDFYGEENVPIKAITMGIGTIMKAKRVIIMAWGEGKASIVQKAVEGQVSDHVPATYLQGHDNTTFFLDEASGSALTRMQLPWTLGPCEWEDKILIKRATIWLSQKLEKPILKLTNRDYSENGMSDLITEYDDAYNINIEIFNILQRTITGWPGGKHGADDTHRPERANPKSKKCLIFSPHPDDDVISMGGTFIRLHEQKHDVHVAFQTSGNIAVFDDEVLRFTDFVKDFGKLFEVKSDLLENMFGEIRNKLDQKKPGDIDDDRVRSIKGLIRRGESKSASRYVGIKDENVYFMDMPFYETGAVKKNDLSQLDVDITKELLRKTKPHQIYAAGDLSDPHGTHRVCLKAITTALDQCKAEGDKWIEDCYVWLYKGAWQEWAIEDIDMAIPLSPEELLKKRKAIFKHQSQKDRPVFPGSDPREFWQRSEDRNHNTAKVYDQLGLAEYEAIEGFKRYYF